MLRLTEKSYPVWDINDSHYVDALMINTAESRRNGVMDGDFLRYERIMRS